MLYHVRPSVSATADQKFGVDRLDGRGQDTERLKRSKIREVIFRRMNSLKSSLMILEKCLEMEDLHTVSSRISQATSRILWTRRFCALVSSLKAIIVVEYCRYIMFGDGHSMDTSHKRCTKTPIVTVEPGS